MTAATVVTPGNYSVAPTAPVSVSTGGLTLTTTFSTAADAYLPDFARGPQDAVNVPATSTGLPVDLENITAANAVKSVSMTLNYNPALLTVTGAALGSSVPSGWTLAPPTISSGQVVLTASGTTALPATSISSPDALFTLAASVPAAATYGAMDPVTITNLSLNSGGVTAYAGEAIHKVAYVGNASGNGAYGSLSASLIAQDVAHAISDFPSYPACDPTIIAGDGAVSVGEAIAVSQETVHLTVPSIPALPSGVVPITPVPGNDPLVSIAQNVQALPGGTAVVPVSIAGPAGVEAINLVFSYDTSRLQLSDSGVTLAGPTAKGWSLAVNVENGVAYVSAFSSTPLPACNGTFLDLDFQVPAKAPAGSANVVVSAQRAAA